MGGRANPLRDAAAIVGFGQTGFATQIDGPEGQLANGAAVAALRDGGIDPSESDVHGCSLGTEGVRQQRGTSTSQVEGATTCLVTSGEGVPTSAVVLRAA